MMRDFEKLTDEQVVEEVRSDDQELYHIIVERYQEKLLRYAVNIVKDDDKAMDVVQNSFIKAFINLNGFNVKKKFSSWIYRIVHNEAMNTVNKHRRELPITDDIDFSSDENIENNYESKEIAEKVNKCLKEIPILYSEPLSLFYIDEKSYEEISDILRIPMGTVATRISRAKIIMRKICQKN
jgi:RNA polymerase sigma-70 factor (ECF subfamily)